MRTVWFNAWKYPSDDTVLAGLLGALLDVYRQSDSKLDELSFQVSNHKTRLARTVLHAAAPWAFGKPGDAAAWTGRWDAVDEKRAFNDVFRELFTQAAYQLFHPGQAIRDLSTTAEAALWDDATCRKHTVALFLDDLDRCRPERVMEVLEAINLFLDLPGVCFYLGLDMERLEDLLPEHLGAHKAQFLEKIVQISLDLPEVSRGGVEDYVGALLAETRLRALLRQATDAAEQAEAEADAEQAPRAGHDDIAVIAAALRSRHPRHVKRFLNDLALSLAVLRNTGGIGAADDADKLPAEAVVAWHLLREALAPAKWREVRALTANLVVFLRQWQAARETTADEQGKRKRPEGWYEGLIRLSTEGVLDGHIAVLRGLNLTQLDLLVHTGSPPREPAAAEAAVHDGTDLVWIAIPAGRFRMGADDISENERPIHAVSVPAFEIARDPVTNAQYAAFVEATGHGPPPHWENGAVPEGKAQHPVVHVSWEDAHAYCAWLTERQADGHQVLLLSEAEWEFAARGEDGRDYPWGAEEPSVDRCNFGRNVGDTTPVGSYPAGATPEGVRDLAGNVVEWVQDHWHESYEGAPEDGSPWEASEAGAGRVMRGGAWGVTAQGCRSACRSGNSSPLDRGGALGFRCARLQIP